jgi:hypothetical protein
MHSVLIALLMAAVGQTSAPPSDRGHMELLQSTALAEYVYPGAAAEAAGSGTDLRQTVLTTPDAPAQVLAFYESKLGESLGATCFHGRPDGWVASCNDSRVPATGDTKTSPLVLHVLSKRSGAEHLTIVISRAAGESLTHVVILLEA